MGVLIGTLVGVLPGLGPVAAISLLLPSTLSCPRSVRGHHVAGIYYGAMYGGSTTSILLNLPGEAASVVSCLDGYQMARKGRAGIALGMSAFGSFIAGTLGLSRPDAHCTTPCRGCPEIRPTGVLFSYGTGADPPHISCRGSMWNSLLMASSRAFSRALSVWTPSMACLVSP